jgi:3-oxoacyl-[acyl-carrier protein] reductase
MPKFGGTMNFLDRVVLVTGGSRRIGAATARAIASAGGSVVVHYGSNDGTAEKLRSEIGHDNCHLIRADLGNFGAASGLWSDAIQRKGKFDVLVNNDGVFLTEDCTGPDEAWRELWLRTLQINLISAGDLCREAINHWLTAKVGGSIVNVAKRAAFRGDSPDHWSYAASKGAMVSRTKTLARAYSGNGIYTYGVAPGFVPTDMAQAEFDHDKTLRQRLINESPYGEIAPAEEIANAICFFASGLATHATGQTLDVNGASYVR